MIDAKTLTELTREIMAQGHDEKTASRFAILIGDTPIRDSADNVIVQDQAGAVVATLAPLVCFDPA